MSDSNEYKTNKSIFNKGEYLYVRKEIPFQHPMTIQVKSDIKGYNAYYYDEEEKGLPDTCSDWCNIL